MEKDYTEVKYYALRLGIFLIGLALFVGGAESPYRTSVNRVFTIVTLALAFLLIGYSKSGKATD